MKAAVLVFPGSNRDRDMIAAHYPGLGVEPVLAALVAALLFAVHPIGSGCVNYISARSSSLTAALLLPAPVRSRDALSWPAAQRRPGSWADPR